MRKQIIIDIKKDGTSKIEAVGYVGNSCEKATEPFEELLGTVEGKDYKNEYYEQEHALNGNNETNNIKQY